MLLERAKNYFQNLNLFETSPPSTDPSLLRTQRISTRIFISLLIYCLLILLLYTSTIQVIRTANIEKPNLNQYFELYKKHAQILTCSCGQTSIPYSTFLRLNYRLHPVCNSSYISDEFIRHFPSPNEDYLQYSDFRLYAPLMLQGIRSLCSLVNDTIQTNLNEFLQRYHVSHSPISPDVFPSQWEASINLFISTTTENLLASLRLLRNTIQANAFLSASFSNYVLGHKLNSQVIAFVRHYIECDCQSMGPCISEVALYKRDDFTMWWKVPGFRIGCFIIEALFQSTLECFFDDECLANFHFWLGADTTMNTSVLNRIHLVTFSAETTIGVMLEYLMVDQWQVSATYEDYFTQCQLHECTYTFAGRNDITYIITTIIGLVGGLVTALKFIIPHLVTFIWTKIKRTTQPNPIHFHCPIQIIVQWWTHFNLFASSPPTQDPKQLRIQFISTHLFLILFIFCLTILIVYTSTIQVFRIIKIKSPTIDDYLALYKAHGDTLKCPCSEISIPYSSFIRINYTLHQVCHSIYITQQFKDYVDSGYAYYDYPEEFLLGGSSSFQALRSLCELSEKTITVNLRSFLKKQYVSISVTAERFLQAQFEVIIQQFISSMAQNLILSIRSIRATVQTNALVPAMFTNYDLTTWFAMGYNHKMDVEYDNGCSCAETAQCITPAVIYPNGSIVSAWIVPGFYRGCFVLESLLLSTLECFFDQTCVDTFRAHVNPNGIVHMPSLNGSALKKFPLNTRIGNLFESLMIDQWNSLTMHVARRNVPMT